MPVIPLVALAVAAVAPSVGDLAWFSDDKPPIQAPTSLVATVEDLGGVPELLAIDPSTFASKSLDELRTLRLPSGEPVVFVPFGNPCRVIGDGTAPDGTRWLHAEITEGPLVRTQVWVRPDRLSASKPPGRLEPDVGWTPEPGDRCQAHAPFGGNAIAAASEMFAFQEMVKFFRAKDDAGIEGLAKQGRLAIVENGTGVLVLKRHVNRFIADGIPAVEVRFTSGPQKDKAAWMLEANLVRYVERPRLFPDTRPILPPRMADPGVRAASLLRQAQNLEKIGRKEQAIEFYRQIIERYPKTPSAGTAAERVEVLSP